MDEAKKEKYLKIFRAEAEDLLKKFREGLLALESNTQDAETFNVILRSAHTLKGSARMVGLEDVGKLAHKMEDLLKAVESGKQKMSETVASLLFNGIELVEKMMSSSGQADSAQLEGLIEKLAAAAEGKKVSKQAVESSLKVEEVSDEKVVPMETLRVEAARLDKMINISSQLVLDRIRFESNMYKFKKGVDDLDDFIKANQEVLRRDLPALAKQMDELSHRFREYYQTHYEDVIELEHDVQETHFQALFLRMFPISILFEEFPYYLRDLAKELGKKIDLKLEGGESELDKRVLEELRGPMVHLLRNSCDHGVETPEERKKAGKPESGKISIKAYPKGNQIVIEIRDDGRGMDLERIRQKAVELGYFEEKAASAVGEGELVQLIFAPGFSTSKIVTAVSGRGVGMDVVKTSIERLGGDIHVETEKGKGTLITLQVPFTLGILRCVLAMIGDVVYAFPTHSLEGSLRISMDHIQTDRGQPLISFRQDMVPVYYLGDLLGFDQKQGWPQRDGHLSILIISHSQQRMAVVVDKILREDEVVTKSFGYPLAGAVKYVSGSTLLRAGEIGLIINIFDLFDEARGRHLKPQMTVSQPAVEKKKIQVLVVDDSLTSRIVERNLLEQAGYDVELAESAEQALEKVEKKSFDIFLVDVEMPGMNGFDLTRRLKSDARTKRTPVVIVSTRSTEEDKRMGIDAGAQGYVIKSKLEPVDFIRLIKHLVGE